MKEIYLIRHGETKWARDGKHTSFTDLHLTEIGQKEAAFLGKRIYSIKFSHIFSSPLKRAIETSKICGFNAQIDKDLVEWNYGAYEGLTSVEIHKTNPEWNIFFHGAPSGESIEAVINRADRFLKKIEHLEGKIAVFSSGHFCRTLAIRWLEMPLKRGRHFSLATASLSILAYEHTKRALKLWNDISHKSTT